jgi:pimeloyl-ACP methyl ester carboxylesterase
VTARRQVRASAAEFEHRGHRIHYESWGEGDQVVVYIHGLLLDARLNRGIARALAERGNRVLLIDLLGHGRSDKPARASEHRMDLYVRQVVGLLDELGLERAVIGGVSLGADVALLMASLAPERVQGLVIEMPVLEWATPFAAMTFVPLLMLLRYARGVAGALAALARRLPQTPFDPLNSFIGAVSLQPEQSEAVLHGILVGPVAPTYEERRAITVPTLVLAHRRDMIHPLSDASNLADQMPAARLVRARSPVELRIHPERLTREIVTFLDEVWAGVPAPA